MATTDLVPVATQTARRIFGSRRAGRLGPQKDVEQRPPSRGWRGRGSACGLRVFAQLRAPAAPAARTRPAPFSGCSLRSGVQAPPASADAPVFLTPALAPSARPGADPVTGCPRKAQLSDTSSFEAVPSAGTFFFPRPVLGLLRAGKATLALVPSPPAPRGPRARCREIRHLRPVRAWSLLLPRPPLQQSVPGLPREQFSAAELQAGRKLCAAQMGLFWVTAQKE